MIQNQSFTHLQQKLTLSNSQLQQIQESLDLSIKNAYRTYSKNSKPRGVVALAKKILTDTTSDIQVIIGAETQNAGYMSTQTAVNSAINNCLNCGLVEILAIIIKAENPEIYGIEFDTLDEFCNQVEIFKFNENDTLIENVCYVTNRPELVSASKNFLSKQKLKYQNSNNNNNLKLLYDPNILYKSLNIDLPQEKFVETIKSAMDVVCFSHTPYSNYAIGCALLLKDGSVVAGTNIETFTHNVCHAEKSAISRGISEGSLKEFENEFREQISLVVNYAPSHMPGSPCGGCRQFFLEFTEVAPFLGICNSEKVVYSEGFTTGKNFSMVYDVNKDEFITEEIINSGLVPSPFGRRNLT